MSPSLIPQCVRTADGSLTLKDADCAETYHSTFGALTESQVVFLQNSGVEERLRQQRPTRIFEVGFGTGMNFLLSATAALAYRCAINYTSVENRLLPRESISTILRDTFPDAHDSIQATEHTIAKTRNQQQSPGASQINQYTQLTLLLQDALQTDCGTATFDAIYLDAFSSKNNPLLWQASYLEKLHSMLAVDGVLATYSVNRSFRDALTVSGFDWKKHRGPPGKREVLTAWRRQ